ncbi:hypothetical protein K9B35_12640 [Sphingomonas sp. R647]|uniref:hypothetical protein n=1 Tax=Sphingomonas sp. R647 TaxID=2875233 RepID=UPI001CD37A0B|nr:hypothetical protein [Sphingomonas sp. R647]MCA1198817.1 hypothetical protein [Sphingomonas sp. R647]
MLKFGDFISSYGWLLALVAALIVTSIVLAWRARAQRSRRERQRVRQRMWDWLMMRPNVRRLTHQPDQDQV